MEFSDFFCFMKFCFIHEKTYIIVHMSVKAWEGGGIKVLADMSARNVSFLDGSPLADTTTWTKTFNRRAA